jgi:glycogen operon protein
LACLRPAGVDWHGVELDRPDWADHSHSLAFSLTSLGGRFRLHGMLNAYWEPLRFQLPPARPGTQGAWRRWIDTSLPFPEDIAGWEGAPGVTTDTYLVQPRSIAVLGAPPAGGKG